MNATSKKQRLRLNLRMMLGITLVLTSLLGAFCFLMGAKAKQVKAERQTVSWVKEHGGSVKYGLFGTVVEVDFCGTRSTIADMSPLATLANLETLYVHQTEYELFREIEHSLPKCEVWVYVQAAQL